MQLGVDRMSPRLVLAIRESQEINKDQTIKTTKDEIKLNPSKDDSGKLEQAKKLTESSAGKSSVPSPEIQGAERFAINTSRLDQSQNLTPGPFNNPGSAKGFGAIYQTQKGQTTQAQQANMAEMQKSQRIGIFMGKLQQKQAMLAYIQDKSSCRIYVDDDMLFAEIQCIPPDQISQIIQELSGPITFVPQLVNKAQCLEIGSPPKELSCQGKK